MTNTAKLSFLQSGCKHFSLYSKTVLDVIVVPFRSYDTSQLNAICWVYFRVNPSLEWEVHNLLHSYALHGIFYIPWHQSNFMAKWFLFRKIQAMLGKRNCTSFEMSANGIGTKDLLRRRFTNRPTDDGLVIEHFQSVTYMTVLLCWNYTVL